MASTPHLPAVADVEHPIPASPDPATAAVLAALDQAAQQHLRDIRPPKTKAGYARDWALWQQYLDWLAAPERTGHRLPDTSVTTGTLTGFVVWLDQVRQAAPNSIDRRITGVTVTARQLGTEVPKAATNAARQALKPLKLDKTRQARGRGKAVPTSPALLRAMNTAPTDLPAPAGSRRRRREYTVPPLARLRDRALTTLSFAIAGRSSEVSALDDTGVTLVDEGLIVDVPSVKGRPGRTVAVAYGQHPDSCPVRCWMAWLHAKHTVGAPEHGPAFLAVDQWGTLGQRLGPDGCRIVITRAGERAQLPVRLTGHSQRAGLITTSTKAGKRQDKIRAQSGHSDNSPVFHGYIRDGHAWEDAATDGIGL